jgi:SHS2 domain-containing protein
MPYRYIEDVAIADIALEAWGWTIEEMFISAADATINVMVAELDSIQLRDHRHFRMEDTQLDLLLLQTLQELIYYKDAEQLLLRIASVQISFQDDHWTLSADAAGETLNLDRHNPIVDVKAVTLHLLRVEKRNNEWTAVVVLDI